MGRDKYVLGLAEKIWRYDCNYQIMTGTGSPSLSFLDIHEDDKRRYLLAAEKVAKEVLTIREF